MCGGNMKNLVDTKDMIEQFKKHAGHLMFDSHGYYTSDGLLILNILSSLPSTQICTDDADLITRESVLWAKMSKHIHTNSEYQRGWNDACDAIAGTAPSAHFDLSEYRDKLWKNAFKSGKKFARVKKCNRHNCRSKKLK